MSDGIESAQAALTIGTEYVSQSGALDCPLEEKVPSNLIEEGPRNTETSNTLSKRSRPNSSRKEPQTLLRTSGKLVLDEGANLTLAIQQENLENGSLGLEASTSKDCCD